MHALNLSRLTMLITILLVCLSCISKNEHVIIPDQIVPSSYPIEAIIIPAETIIIPTITPLATQNVPTVNIPEFDNPPKEAFKTSVTPTDGLANHNEVQKLEPVLNIVDPDNTSSEPLQSSVIELTVIFTESSEKQNTTQVVGILNKNRVNLIEIEVTLIDTTYPNTIKKVSVENSKSLEEYIVELHQTKNETYYGQIPINPLFLGQPNIEWVHENLTITTEDFPERVACTGSMRPVLYCGDKIEYEPANVGSPLQVGDIVTFRQNANDIDATADCPVYGNSVTLFEGYIIHRITKIIPGHDTIKYMTQGDNNKTQDSCLVRKQQIIYRVKTITPRFWIENELSYDESIAMHQSLIEERIMLIDAYDLAKFKYNGFKSDELLAKTNKAVQDLNNNLQLITEYEQSITSSINWDN